MNITKWMFIAFWSCFAATATATEWLIDNSQSQLNFISIKKVNIAEVHQFKQISGGLDAQGQFELIIDLASVDTHIPLRDQRMKDYFFDIGSFATATVSATIDMEEIDAIAQGRSARLIVDGKLDLHGEQKALKLDVIVTRLVSGKLLVVSTQPVILNIADFSLVAGIDKLRELAKLPSISYAVPISFNLSLNLKR